MAEKKKKAEAESNACMYLTIVVVVLGLVLASMVECKGGGGECHMFGVKIYSGTTYAPPPPGSQDSKPKAPVEEEDDEDWEQPDAVPLENGGEVHSLSIKGPELLKEALYSGNPWLVWCDARDVETLVDEKSLATSKGRQKLVDAVDTMGEENMGIKIGVLDCSKKLPKGDTIKKRYGLDGDIGHPIVFLAANGKPPKQLTRKDMKTSETLIARVTELAKQETIVYNKYASNDSLNRKFQSQCFRSKKTQACVVLLAVGGKVGDDDEEAVGDLMKQHRKHNVIVVDRDMYSLGEALGAPFKALCNGGDDKSKPGMVVLKQLPMLAGEGEESKPAGKLVTLDKRGSKEIRIGALIGDSELGIEGLSKVLAAVEEGKDEGFDELAAVPRLKWRKGGKGGKSKGKSSSRGGGSSDGGSSGSSGSSGDDSGGKPKTRAEKLQAAANRANRKAAARKKARMKKRNKNEEKAAEPEEKAKPKAASMSEDGEDEVIDLDADDGAPASGAGSAEETASRADGSEAQAAAKKRTDRKQRIADAKRKHKEKMRKEEQQARSERAKIEREEKTKKRMEEQMKQNLAEEVQDGGANKAPDDDDEEEMIDLDEMEEEL